MPRLNERAFAVLIQEVNRCAGTNPIWLTQKSIVLKRLEKLRQQAGNPVTEAELQEQILDMLPHFDPKVLQAAAKLNQPESGAWFYAKLTVASLVGVVGGLYVLNLPYPMIRWPVAQVAPILLLPSFIQMDHNYRAAISLVQQSDQLVNQATSQADLELGEQKVLQSQKHLDQLPVWFLGYYPRYSFWRGWQFTLDEFQSARANIGRMQAKVFQEKNAQKLLSDGDQAVSAAKQQYQQAQSASEKAAAIANWQAGIDQLQQIPAQTLAGRQATPKMAAYKRDLQQISGLATTTTRSGNLIEAAQQFGNTANQSAQNPPHTSDEWAEVANLLQQAIDRLNQVTPDDPGYPQAQKLLVTYQKNLGVAKIQLKAEQEAQTALTAAKARMNELLAIGPLPANQLRSRIQAIADQLETIKSGTTAHKDAQELLASAEKRLKQLGK